MEQTLLRIAELNLEKSDFEFFCRVWEQKTNIYEDRLKAINFIDKEKVLDAGCGLGQWSVALSKLNKKVYSFDISDNRVNVVKELIKTYNINNIDIELGNIENLEFQNDYFDSIFCYSVIFLTNLKKSLQEIYRVLKPNGKVYFTANGLGWYINCIVNERNKSENYNPRNMAIDSINNSLCYLNNKNYVEGTQLVISSEIMKEFLSEVGFKDIIIKSEGTINLFDKQGSRSFYESLEDYGVENIYEVLATK